MSELGIEIGSRIKQARIKKGLKQSALGIEIGLSKKDGQNMISGYEIGKSVPSAARLKTIANALEVSIDWLVTGSKSKFSGAMSPLTFWELLPGTMDVDDKKAVIVIEDKDVVDAFRNLYDLEQSREMLPEKVYETSKKYIFASIVDSLLERAGRTF